MKIFWKERKESGRIRIYFLGIRVFSYRKRCSKYPMCDIFNYQLIQENNISLPHPVGIVISRYAKIGKNCTIYQNVTIGTKKNIPGKKYTSDDYPTIGNNVTIYAGAVVVGPIVVGDNAVIGANAVVTKDVPENHMAVCDAAKIIKKKE